MGPKKQALEEDLETLWRREIENAVLNDDHFAMKVVMIDGIANEQDKIYISKFESMAQNETRYVIKNICKTETIFMINQLGGDKKGKEDPSLRVFEEANIYTKEKKEIPPDIMALIIKKLAMKMKEDYLVVRHQKLEVKEGLRQESATMLDRAVVKGTIDANRPPREPPEPMPMPTKGAKGQPAVPREPSIHPAEGKKYNTALRERGEEWRDKVYVDDYPTDGPNAYLAISGFIDPYLACALVQIGVNVSAVIQIRINPYTVDIPVTFYDGTKRRLSQVDNIPDQTRKYWKVLEKVRLCPETADILKNTAFIIFSPPYNHDEEALSADSYKIYDELSYLMYDIQDLTRQHQHYLNNMDIESIPEYTDDPKPLSHYKNLISDVPLECITIYSVLDALLETTCELMRLEASSQSSMTLEATSHQTIGHTDLPATDDPIVNKAERVVTNVFTRLCQTEESHKSYRMTYGEEYEEHKDPVIIKYGDYAKYNNFHLGNFNLNHIVIETLLGMPINLLWRYQKRPELEMEAKVNFHVNVLLSCFEREDVETAELNRLLHILACRKLYTNRSSLKKKHLGPNPVEELKKSFLKRSILAEPLRSPYSSAKDTHSSLSFTRNDDSASVASSFRDNSEVDSINLVFDCPDISELVSAAEIANNRATKNIIDEFEFFEDFTDVNALQIMLDAFNKFNCVDYKYCEVTDCIVLMFFNSHDKDDIAREEWRNHLPTPVCLQDFFDFILDEHYDWIENEERIYDENKVMQEQSQMNNVFNTFATTSCIDDSDVESDLLMEGSLKHQARLDEVSSFVSTGSPTINTSPTSDRKPEMSPTAKTLDKGTKNEKPEKKRKKSFLADPSSHMPSDIQIVRKPFSGYDLGDRRFEIIGKDSTFFSQDGTKVLTQYSLMVPLDIENVILHVVPGNGSNEFWIHKTLGERYSPEDAEVSQSFRVVTKDQVMINIKKRKYEIPIEPLKSQDSENTIKTKINKSDHPFPNMKTVSEPTKASDEETTKSIPFHSLYVTWPNGHITETVHVDNSSDISHIKQMFVTNSPLQNEDMRCISLYGEVLIFKKSGHIEVLRPGGVHILITKILKKVDHDPTKSQTDITNSSKTKKGPKEKIQSTKEPTKTNKNKDRSKHSLTIEEIGKLFGYTIDILDFEIIETSGLRQKWHEDTHINIERLLIRTATDYILGEIFSRRMDGTHCLLNKDGILIVTFPDKTRIMTQFVIDDEEIYPEWTESEKECFELTSDSDLSLSDDFIPQKSGKDTISIGSVASDFAKKSEAHVDGKPTKQKPIRQDGYVSVQIIYTVENSYCATVAIDKQQGTVSVSSPNSTCVTVDLENHYDLSLDSATCAKFDGTNLHIEYEACPECKSFTYCDIDMNPQEPETPVDDQSESSPDQPSTPTYWLQMKDSFCKKLVVTNDGNMMVLDEPCSQEMSHTEHVENEAAEPMNKHETEECPEETKSDVKSETSTHMGECHGKCRVVDDGKCIRFFVLHRDLSCSELVQRTLVEKYKQTCRWLPWCSINQYDTFGDHRTLWSLLTPIYLTETEKWRMDSKLADKPKYLAYKDLKPDCGKGFYQWMRPYERFTPQPVKQENVLPPRLPRAFVLRTLEQQWRDSEREQLQGARELLNAILKYRQVIAEDRETLLHIPIKDDRTEQEKTTDQLVQEIGHKICRSLRKSLYEDLKNRSETTITTTPAPTHGESSVEEEEEVEAEEEVVSVEQLEEVVPVTTNLQRYWRRRREELKEEMYFLYLLRESGVPPYFLGSNHGAIWWEVNRTAGEVLTIAERRKTTCICAEKETKEDHELQLM